MHEVTKIARHHERRRQFRYEHEKTKNGHITPNPHAGAISECITAQAEAEITAKATCRLVINDIIQSPPAMSNVSNGGPIMTIIINSQMAEPLNSGPVFSDIIPLIPKISTKNSEGIRLIRPVRKMYFHIGI